MHSSSAPAGRNLPVVMPQDSSWGAVVLTAAKKAGFTGLVTPDEDDAWNAALRDAPALAIQQFPASAPDKPGATLDARQYKMATTTGRLKQLNLGAVKPGDAEERIVKAIKDMVAKF